VRVFDRQGKYLRTIMPFNPNLPRSSVQDLCRMMAREGRRNWSSRSFSRRFAARSPCTALVASAAKNGGGPNGDLILANIYRGTLWRIGRTEVCPWKVGLGLPSRHAMNRSKSHDWTPGFPNVQDLQNYLAPLTRPFTIPTSVSTAWFDVRLGRESSRPTRQTATLGVSQQEVPTSGSAGERRDGDVTSGSSGCIRASRSRLGSSAASRAERAVIGRPHLIVADSGNNACKCLRKTAVWLPR